MEPTQLEHLASPVRIRVRAPKKTGFGKHGMIGKWNPRMGCVARWRKHGTTMFQQMWSGNFALGNHRDANKHSRFHNLFSGLFGGGGGWRAEESKHRRSGEELSLEWRHLVASLSSVRRIFNQQHVMEIGRTDGKKGTDKSGITNQDGGIRRVASLVYLPMHRGKNLFVIVIFSVWLPFRYGTWQLVWHFWEGRKKEDTSFSHLDPGLRCSM